MCSSAYFVIGVRWNVSTLIFLKLLLLPYILFRVGCARLADVSRGALGPRSERSEGSFLDTSAGGSNPSGLRVLLHALTAKLSINSFFSLG